MPLAGGYVSRERLIRKVLGVSLLALLSYCLFNWAGTRLSPEEEEEYERLLEMLDEREATFWKRSSGSDLRARGPAMVLRWMAQRRDGATAAAAAQKADAVPAGRRRKTRTEEKAALKAAVFGAQAEPRPLDQERGVAVSSAVATTAAPGTAAFAAGVPPGAATDGKLVHTKPDANRTPSAAAPAQGGCGRSGARSAHELRHTGSPNARRAAGRASSCTGNAGPPRRLSSASSYHHNAPTLSI